MALDKPHHHEESVGASKVPTTQDWENVRKDIEELYIMKRLPLSRVKTEMERRGFIATYGTLFFI
jgi:hypothetical protein